MYGFSFTQLDRQSTFLEQKKKVESLFQALGEVPIFQFDKMILGDPDKFLLSKSNLDELQVQHTIHIFST